jgi:hypothetical protein
MLEKELFQARPVISLYEGDDGDGGPSAADLASAAADAAADLAAANQNADVANDPDQPVVGDPNARFNQEQVNRFVQDRLAKERKKQREENQKIQKKLEEVLATQSLTEEEKASLQNTIEDMRKRNRTKEEQAKLEKRQLQEEYENRLKDALKRGDYWENEYRTQTVTRALMDAAVKNDAFMPNQVVTILKEYTKLVKPVDENGKQVEGAPLHPVVDLPDIDADTGKTIITQRNPDEAVARLKELQPNLFKANVVSGVGGNSSTGGVAPGQDGRVDVSQLTTQQFMELYKKDPTLVGARKRRTF